MCQCLGSFLRHLNDNIKHNQHHAWLVSREAIQNARVRDGPFDIQGSGCDCFEKNSLFPIRSEKNKMPSKKLKSLFFIQ